MPEEHREKIRAALKGKNKEQLSDTHRSRIAASMKRLMTQALPLIGLCRCLWSVGAAFAHKPPQMLPASFLSHLEAAGNIIFRSFDMS